MMESKKLCDELEELEMKKLQLQKLKDEALVAEDKAYSCRKCNTMVLKDEATPAQSETSLCYNCFYRQRKKEHNEAILNKIRFGRIIDLELDPHSSWYDNIKRITVYKQGMMYELRAVYEDQNAYLVIDKEWQEDEPLESFEEPKPWQKVRTERSLETFKC